MGTKILAGHDRPGGENSADRQQAGGRERNADRERTADRLLRSTAARSYDPDLDIDWAAPLAEGKWFLPEHRCSLYGTPLWERLSPQQRLELGKHEAASVAGVGIWLEFLLLRMLAKVAYHGDPASRHIQYALAEMADECRHSTMFARMIERLGTPVYGPPRHVQRLGSILPAVARGPAMWGAVLIGEEITDRFQREMVGDESIQPLMRMVNRIHIMEEARHIGFARAELMRSAQTMSRTALPAHRLLLARTGFVVARSLINPQVYRSVGLDPRAGRRAALANPHHQEAVRFGGEKVMAFLDEAGLVGGPGMPLWRKSFLVA
jgi:para-aminobenzoate N-oxygenase AurF